MISALVAGRKTKPLVSHAALVIQLGAKSQQSTEMGILLERDVDSLHGIIKIFPSLTGPAPAAAPAAKYQDS